MRANRARVEQYLSALLLGSICAHAIAFGQTSEINAYKTFSPQGSSAEVIDKINNELNSGSSAKAFQTLVHTERGRLGYLNSQGEIDSYISSFNQTLDQTRRQQQTREFLYKTGAE